MTYPPQQPYGGQDPYGQGQQPGQYGGGFQGGQYGGQQQYGGYQQPGQYPGTAQYGGGFQGGQYGGFGGPPPPQKKNTGMVVAVVAIVVLVLGGLGVTGFVAPGFFLSDDKSDNAGGGGTDTSESEQPDGGGAAEFIAQLVEAADGKDSDALTEMSCSDASDNVTEAITDIDEISGAELGETEEVSESEVKAMVDITVDGETGTFETLVVKDADAWCWKDIELSGGSIPSDDGSTPAEPADSSAPAPGGGGGGGEPGAEEGQAFVEEFLTAINSGDSAKATAVLCGDSDSQTDVTDAITAGAELSIDPAGLQAQDEYVGADLTGTYDGAPVSAARTSAFYEANGWCIFTFYAF
jgi:hypothetical protein